MDPLDPFRAANLIIQQHGKDAKAHAVQRVQEMRAAGNARGEWAWMGVFDAVLAMEATRPAEGEQVHCPLLGRCRDRWPRSRDRRDPGWGSEKAICYQQIS